MLDSPELRSVLSSTGSALGIKHEAMGPPPATPMPSECFIDIVVLLVCVSRFPVELY